MSGEVLRRAAVLMRERAAAARDVRGVDAWAFGGLAWCDVSGDSYSVLGGAAGIVHRAAEEDATHIASWPPYVAFTVANLMERAADEPWCCDECKYDPANDNWVLEALSVARAYLGEAGS